MKRLMRPFSSRGAAWLLLLTLLLSGCAGGESGGSSDEADASSSADQSGSTETTQTNEPVDYSKYNAYLAVSNSVYEMDGMLTAYFTVVHNQPEFALVEGMDYGMLNDVFSSYTFDAYTMEQAMSYCDEDPAYPEQDALLVQLEEPFQTMGDILGDLAWFITFNTYGETDLTEAAQLHSQLHGAVSAFDAAAQPFAESMLALEESTQQEELDRLRTEGLDIPYYSLVLLDLSDEIDAEIWAQVSQSETLPALDMTRLEELYTQYQEAYAGLAAGLADPEQMAEQWPDEDSPEIERDLYLSAVDSARSALEQFMAAARAGEDYSYQYDTYYTFYSILVDRYNSLIAG